MTPTEGVVLGATVPGGGGGNTFGPTGFAAGYTFDSYNYINNTAVGTSWEWIGGFGGPHPMDNSSGAYYSQDGLDGHDAAWGHVRRMEGNGFIYWTPNNSVCWRRPPSWPSDCAAAPAGENPPTNPPHVVSGNGGLTSFPACAWRSNSDSFQRGSMEVTCWFPFTEINFGAMGEESPGGVNAPAIAGAIDGVATTVGSAVTGARVRGVSGGAMYVEGSSPTITWYLIEASDVPPLAGPYLVWDAVNNFHRTWWMCGALETAIGGWTMLTSATSAQQTTAWVNVSDAAVASGIAGQYARYTAAGWSPGEISVAIAGPSHYVVGVIGAQLTDTSPYKDTTNPDGFHLHGFDSNCTVEVEAHVTQSAQYVMYDQTAVVPGDPCPTTKMINMNRGYLANDVLTALFETTFLDGLQLRATMNWDPESITSGSGYPWALRIHAFKWGNQFTGAFFWHVLQGTSNNRTYNMIHTWIDPVLDWVDYDFYNESSYPSAQMVTGNGVYWVHKLPASRQWELYRTSNTRVTDDWINDFIVQDQYGNSPFPQAENIWPGPGNKIIMYNYDNVFDVFTCTDSATTGITYSRTAVIPSWDGDYGSAFTDWQIHRVLAEPNHDRMWVTAYRPNYDNNYSAGTQRYGFFLVACYDFATGEWSNIIQQLADYDNWTYMGEDYCGVGISNDGPYLVCFTTPNMVDQDVTAVSDFEKIAASLGEWIVRPITRAGNVISWGGAARHLMYRDQNWMGYQHNIWSADPWSGGIFTHVPIDMRTTYVDEQQPLWANQFSALTGSGTAATSLMIYDGYSEMAEISWPSCNLLKWLRLNQRDDKVGNRIAINPRLDGRGSPNPASSRALSKAPRITKRNDHGYE